MITKAGDLGFCKSKQVNLVKSSKIIDHSIFHRVEQTAYFESTNIEGFRHRSGVELNVPRDKETKANDEKG